MKINHYFFFQLNLSGNIRCKLTEQHYLFQIYIKINKYDLISYRERHFTTNKHH